MEKIKTVIFDLDGVVYRGETAVEHAVDTIAWLHAQDVSVFFCTNNASRSRAFFAEKMTRLGIQAEPAQVFTSAYCCGLWFKSLGGGGEPCALVVGEEGLKGELQAAGVRVLQSDEPPERAGFVVAGINRQVTYEDLKRAHLAIAHGAQFVATNRDSTFPMETGTIPGAGAIIAAIETSTGVAPFVIGKPEPFIIEKILEAAGCACDRALAVGDRLDTDIASARRAGVACALVLTGISTRNEAVTAPPAMKPDYVIDDLRGLHELLRE